MKVNARNRGAELEYLPRLISTNVKAMNWKVVQSIRYLLTIVLLDQSTSSSSRLRRICSSTSGVTGSNVKPWSISNHELGLHLGCKLSLPDL